MGTIYRNGTAFIGSGGAGGVELTQAEYDALPTTEKMNGSIYFISDGEASYPSASTMRYDNSTSGLTATSVQDAVDEVNEKVNDNAWDIAELNNGLITTRSFTRTIGESVASGGVKSYTISVSLSGYRALGIIQISGSGTGNFAFQDQSLINDGTTANIYVRNVASNAATINSLNVVILYLKA